MEEGRKFWNQLHSLFKRCEKVSVASKIKASDFSEAFLCPEQDLNLHVVTHTRP